jgi:hypothetical protein
MYCRVLKSVSTDVSEARALMMEAARTSETTVDNDLRTRQYIPEDFELQYNVCLMAAQYMEFYKYL